MSDPRRHCGSSRPIHFDAAQAQGGKYADSLARCDYRPYEAPYAVGKTPEQRPHPATFGTRNEIRRNADMQSCRMVSASGTYGKDRAASDESQDRIRYPEITGGYDGGPKPRPMCESNVVDLKIDRGGDPPRPSHRVPRGGCAIDPSESGVGSCSIGPPLASAENIPQSYSPVESVSPACRSCCSK